MTKQQNQLKITLKKSPIGYAKDQKATCFALGLRKMHQTVVRPDNDSVRGMVRKVTHLLQVEEVEAR
jgi:large subunit ribosomal protein L30